MQMSIPITPLLIIGAHKAGTTSLYSALGAHLEIHAPNLKEPGLFTLGNWTDPHEWSRYSRRWLDAPQGTKRWLDGSTTYGQTIKFPGVAEQLAQGLGAETKVIFMVRDPLARIASGYVQLRSEWLRNVAESPQACMDELVEPTLYATHLRSYRDVFGRESVLVMSQEEMAADPVDVMRRTLQFAGLNPSRLDIPRENRMDTKQLPPSWWHRASSLRAVRGLGARLPGPVRAAGGRAASVVAERLGTPAERPSITWEDLGGWASRVAAECEEIRRELDPAAPAWPSLDRWRSAVSH